MSAANPTWKYFFEDEVLARGVERGVEVGNFFSAETTAFMRNASIVSFSPAFSFSLFSATRSASRSVMSASSCCVTCGIIDPVAREVRAGNFLMRDSGAFSVSPNFDEIDLRPRQQVQTAAGRDRCRRSDGVRHRQRAPDFT